MSYEDKQKMRAAERTLMATNGKIDGLLSQLRRLRQSRQILMKDIAFLKSKGQRHRSDVSETPHTP
jgi:chorismate mutase